MKWKDYEEKWQRAWEEAQVFVPKIERKKPKFFITVPYPYTSGALHIGHGRTYTTGDVIARFKRHRGFNVLFPMAFHITGAPILSISDRIAKGDVKTIALYREYVRIYEKDEKKVEEIVKSFVEPENVARYFAERISADFKSIGYSIDWTRQFNTGMPFYNKFVEWQYHKLRERGVLVKGSHPILMDVKDGQPVGEDDIVDGDVDRVSIVEYTLIKFPFEDGFLVAATLRPETIFGVTNIWVNPEGIYVKAEVGGERWIVSREAAEKLKFQGRKVRIIKEFRGRELLGRYASSPVNGKKLPVLPAKFVDVDVGTGVVYSVPAHAPYDYQGLLDLRMHPKFSKIVAGIEPIVIISIPGYKVPAKEICERFGISDQTDSRLEEATKEIYRAEFYYGRLNERCGKFAGIAIKDIKDSVKNWLVERGVGDRFYETSRKAVTRSGNKVIVGVLEEQWFIDYGDEEWKKKAHEWIDSMLIYPEKYRKWFHDTVDWLERRPCTRKRGLGTRFPFDREWVIEPLSDSTIYMAFYTIAPHIREVEPEKLRPEFFDYVFLGRGSAEEVARITGIKKEIIERAREEFLYWYPNDQRHTAPAHVSNHLTFFIMHHIAIFPEKHWPRAITLNELLIREGVKMSKSRGNVIPLAHVRDRYGADLYRLYVIGSADLEAVVDWRERDVQAMRSRLEKFVEIMERASEEEEAEELTTPEKWFIGRFYMALEKATELMENFRFRDALIEIFFKMLNNFKWLEKRSERPYAVVKKIAEDWLIAMAPVIPHTAEEYWHRLGHEDFASLAPWPEVKEIDGRAVEEEEFLRNVVESIREMVKIAGVEPREIWIYTALPWKYRALEVVLKEREKAMKRVKEFDNPKEAAKVIEKFVRGRVWEKHTLVVDEERVLKEGREFLEREFGVKVRINPEEDPLNKKEKSMPFNPGIYLKE